MPANKNALIRYKTIDKCLSNHYRRWTLEDLVDACSDALYEYEGIKKGVSVCTVQADIQMMRSDKLGYNAPIEVYEHKYYRYADRNYSIINMPLSQNDFEVLKEAVDMLRQLGDFDQFVEMADVVSRLQDKLAIAQSTSSPIVNFDSVPDLKGLQWIGPLYGHISHRQSLRITYQSFSARVPSVITFCPKLLKEFRNRWFLFGTKADNLDVRNLALDRIVDVEVAEDVAFVENPKFDAEHFFDDLIGVTKGLNSLAKSVRFWATKEQSNYIKTKPLHRSQKLISEDPKDHSCVFQISVVPNLELISVLMSYGAGIKVLSPTQVVRQMKFIFKTGFQYYGED